MKENNENVLSVSTPVLKLISENNIANNKKSIIFIIGGNPGTVEFYGDFMKTLFDGLSESEQSSRSYDIFCPGHAGHDLCENTRKPSSSDKKYETYGLEFQIKHKREFIHSTLKKYQSSNQYVDIVLVGHSIGAYIILQLLATDAAISKHTTHISLLMPFMFWSQIPYSHRFKLNAFTFTESIQQLVTTGIKAIMHTIFNAHIIPHSLLAFIINTFVITKQKCTKQAYFSNIICNRLFTQRMVGNFLHMGADEIRAVPRDERYIFDLLRDMDTNNQKVAEMTAASVEHVNIQAAASNEYQCAIDTTPSTSTSLDTTGIATLSMRKIHVLYTDYDEWAPVQDIYRLQRLFTENCLPTVKSCKILSLHGYRVPYLSFIQGLGHTFTLRQESTDKVCKDIVKFVTDSLPIAVTAATAVWTTRDCHGEHVDLYVQTGVQKGTRKLLGVCLTIGLLCIGIKHWHDRK